MLTKAHLQYSIKQGKVIPRLIGAKRTEELLLAERMISAYKKAENLTIAELSDEFKSQGFERFALFPAFKELLDDRIVSVEKDSSEIEKKRWELFAVAQKMREEQYFSTKEEFYEVIGEMFEKPITEIKKELYQDLPDLQTIRSFEDFSESDLVERYNLEQVRCLLYHATSLTMRFKNMSLIEKRLLLRKVKFHRLIANISSSQDNIFELAVTGPLSVIEHKSQYSLRMAQFFPHIVYHQNWEIEAQLKIGTRQVVLYVDQTLGIKSHYKKEEPYYPEELLSFMKQFNDQSFSWQAKIAEDYFNLGSQSYCFPDISFENSHKKLVHIELFHKWHESPFMDRIATLDKKPINNLILGVDRSLLKKHTVKYVTENSAFFKKNGVVFSSFLTPQSMNRFLQLFD